MQKVKAHDQGDALSVVARVSASATSGGRRAAGLL